MRIPHNCGILGIGMAVPDRVLSNKDLESIVDTTDDWIISRTGIRERRICGPNDSASTLGIQAAREALNHAGVSGSDLDLIICCTVAGDVPWPATACLIQAELGATRAPAFDLSAACAGFAYGLATAAGFVETGVMKQVLVIGVDTLSKQVDWTDRSTCVLFGDGAGAAVVGPCAPDEGLLSSVIGADGKGFDAIRLGTADNKFPDYIAPNGGDERCFIRMRGAEVYKFAVRIMGDVCLEALSRAGLTTKDVDLFIPHQANIRIIEAAAEKMGLPEEKVFLNVQKYGNTSAASIPMAMTEALQEGRIKRGDVLVTVGFGAGLTWAANVIRWSRDD